MCNITVALVESQWCYCILCRVTVFKCMQDTAVQSFLFISDVNIQIIYTHRPGAQFTKKS